MDPYSNSKSQAYPNGYKGHSTVNASSMSSVKLLKCDEHFSLTKIDVPLKLFLLNFAYSIIMAFMASDIDLSHYYDYDFECEFK